MTGAVPGDGRTAPLVFLVAGEPSGDQLGAKLMAALKDQAGGRVRFAGVGGARMAAEGLDSLVPIDELAVMGVVEVLPHIFRILRRIRDTAAAAKSARPDVVVTIDSPSFTLEVSKRLIGLGVPLIHYVAPSVWAWKPWRARHIARDLDHLLVLLPFEPPYFERHGLATTFVGHPAVEDAARPRDGAAFRRDHGIPADAPLLAVLPGSRKGEVRRLLPAFEGALGLLKSRFADLHGVVATVPTVAEDVVAATTSWPVPVTVVHDTEAKLAAFAASDAALAASGTVAVELAAAGVPAVIAYRVSAISAFLAPRLVKVPHVSLPNILLGREVQPELLQTRCTPEALAEAVGHLLSDLAARDAQRAAYAEAVAMLHPDEETPSHRAARQVLALIDAGTRRQNN